MERTPSTERVIPIEIIGHVSDVSEDEIDIDNFVESMNSKINISKPPKSENDNEKSSSNRGSLIITHEDGSIEENYCTVTCLGISSDLGSNQGLHIEEISQDTLKDKLAEEKLKVVIPDMSQVIILEADEVTDASFVSIPDVEEPSQATETENVYKDINMSFEIEEPGTPHSTTPDIPYSMTQKINDDEIQNQRDEIHKQPQIVDTMSSLNEKGNTKQNIKENTENPDNAQDQKLICAANTKVIESVTPEEDTRSIEILGDVPSPNNGQKTTELRAKCEITYVGDTQQPTKCSRKSSKEHCNFLESTAVADSPSIEVKDIEILEIKINLDEEDSSKDINKNYISQQNSKESDSSDQIRKFIEPDIKDDLYLDSKSEQTSIVEAVYQDKLPLKKEVIAEAVRIIPITLPDGRFVEQGILSDRCVTQTGHSKNEVKDTTKEDRHNTTRTIPIKVESHEVFSISKEENEKEDKDGKKVEEKEIGQQGTSYNNLSPHLIKNSRQSIEKLSEIISMKQINQKVESKDMSNSYSNMMCDNFEKMVLQDVSIKTTTQLPAEVEHELLVKDKREQSKDEIVQDSIKTVSIKDNKNVQEEPAATKSMNELEVKTISTVSDDYKILENNKQTEATQKGNTCSDASSRQLAKDWENEKERNVPILIQTDSEGESEKIAENKTTDSELIKNGTYTKEESHTKIESSISTESISNKMTKASLDEITSKDSVYEKRVSIQRTDSLPCNSTDGQLRKMARDPKPSPMEDCEDTENIKQQEGTQKENTCSGTLYRQSSEAKEDNKISRNIPIQIEKNIECESKNINLNKSKDSEERNITDDENGKFEICASIGEKGQLKEDTSLEAKNQTFGNPITLITDSARKTLAPVVRTVPIQIIDCNLTASEEQVMSIKAETGSTNYEQIQINIPIQRVVGDKERNFTGMQKESKIENNTERQLSKYSQDPKADSSKVEDTTTGKQMTKNKTLPKMTQQSLPINQQQGSITVPIKIQVPDETVEIQTGKKTTTECEAIDNETKISQETPTPTILNPSRFPPPPAVPTSKPPVVVRTIPVLRQSISDSGEGMTRQETGARQRNKSEQSTRGDILQKVHQELEEARAKLTAQANSLSSGLENMPKSFVNKNDPRSRSVESEQRYPGAKPKDVKPRYLFKRERSIQDIDKDIKTIWKELQELDKPDMENENSSQRRSRKSNRAQTPLSEQVLVTPSWRTPTPPPSHSVQTSLSNPNISNANSKHQQPVPQSISPHTIWDTQNTQGPTNEASTFGQISSSWDSKPQYFPTKPATHLSFTPKAETKPGAITPSYVSQTPKSAHPQVRNIPIEKSETNAPKSESQLYKGRELKKESIRTQQAHESSRVFKSEESLKSCLKSEASTFTTQSIKNRSQSPSNVKFFNKHKSAENAPRTSVRSSEPDPPFEWVDFRKADGEIVKGTILPPLHRDNDVIISRELPIINVLLDDAMKEDNQPNKKKNKPIMKEKETQIKNPTELDNKEQKDSPSSGTFNACDAVTQTEKFEKKGGCHIM